MGTSHAGVMNADMERARAASLVAKHTLTLQEALEVRRRRSESKDNSPTGASTPNQLHRTGIGAMHSTGCSSPAPDRKFDGGHPVDGEIYRTTEERRRNSLMADAVMEKERVERMADRAELQHSALEEEARSRAHSQRETTRLEEEERRRRIAELNRHVCVHAELLELNEAIYHAEPDDTGHRHLANHGGEAPMCRYADHRLVKADHEAKRRPSLEVFEPVLLHAGGYLVSDERHNNWLKADAAMDKERQNRIEEVERARCTSHEEERAERRASAELTTMLEEAERRERIREYEARTGKVVVYRSAAASAQSTPIASGRSVLDGGSSPPSASASPFLESKRLPPVLAGCDDVDEIRSRHERRRNSLLADAAMEKERIDRLSRVAEQRKAAHDEETREREQSMAVTTRLEEEERRRRVAELNKHMCLHTELNQLTCETEFEGVTLYRSPLLHKAEAPMCVYLEHRLDVANPSPIGRRRSCEFVKPVLVASDGPETEEERRRHAAIADGLMEKERLARMQEVAIAKHQAIEEERIERRRSGELARVLEEAERRVRIREYEAFQEARRSARLARGPGPAPEPAGIQ